MSARRILIFGSQADLATPAAQALASALRARAGVECLVRDKVPPPARGTQAQYQGAVLVWKSADEAALTRWSQWLKALPNSPRVAVLTEGKLPSRVSELFAPVTVVSSPEAIGEILLGAGASDNTKVYAPEGLASLSLSGLQSPPPPLPDPESLPLETHVTTLSLADFDAPAGEALPKPGEEAAASIAIIDLGESAPPASSDPVADEISETPEAPVEAPGSAPQVSEDDILGLGAFESPDPPSYASRVESGEGTGVPFDPDAEDSAAVLSEGASSSEPVAGQGTDSGFSLNEIWNGAEAAQSASMPQGEPEPAVAQSDEPAFSFGEVPKLSGAPATDEIQTLRRYAALRERESREKEAALQALNRQMEQVRERLNRSETERRRLTMALDESEVGRRTLEDELEQTKHYLSKSESLHQEELRAFQLRLDNAQFQASKAEKKLEDFRERVRNDIQKIRVRERELANRLELQKRDAEALLAAKDERLLHQKRDIDRLEFELETLRERLLEQTQKAEDRVARLSRALKALKMAQGMLSGIEDEVLPNVDDKSDGGEEAA